MLTEELEIKLLEKELKELDQRNKEKSHINTLLENKTRDLVRTNERIGLQIRHH